MPGTGLNTGHADTSKEDCPYPQGIYIITGFKTTYNRELERKEYKGLGLVYDMASRSVEPKAGL